MTRHIEWVDDAREVLRLVEDGAVWFVPADEANVDFVSIRDEVDISRLPVALAVRSVPASVALWKAQVALTNAGLIAAVEGAIATSGNPVLTIAWARAAEISRQSTFIQVLAPLLGLTDQQIDDLFIAADAITG